MKRRKFFPCIAIFESYSLMIYESIQAEDADEAKKIFESKFGFIPEICDMNTMNSGGTSVHYGATFRFLRECIFEGGYEDSFELAARLCEKSAREFFTGQTQIEAVFSRLLIEEFTSPKPEPSP